MSHLYTIDIFEEFSKFRHYHNLFANPQIAEQLQQEYLHMVVEQMIAHFEVETTAVQMFVGHYTQLITDSSVSPLFKYHPLKFLRQMTNEEYQHYIYCLYGFCRRDVAGVPTPSTLYQPRDVVGKLSAH